MFVKVDLVDDVVLLVEEDYQVRDAFHARGITRHESSGTLRYYTYRSLVVMPGTCAVCGYDTGRIDEPCSSSGGFHAFVGVVDGIPPGHLAANRSLALLRLRYDELEFFVTEDNLFDIAEIRQAMIV